MAQQSSLQYAFRAQKSLGLVGGSPPYAPLDSFNAPEGVARTYKYSADGRLYSVAVPSGVQIFLADSAALLQTLPVPHAVEINFSPRGTYISTWERPQKLEDGSQHKNFRIFSVSTGEQLTGFSQKSQDGWDVQYTISESHAVRLVGPDIQVFDPADWERGVVDKLRVENASSVELSPGLNPSLAVFVREKQGAPASVRIFGLTTLASPPTCQKTFFKADRAQIKWNTLGTQVLVLTQTDVDNSNKSYYGETGLYLLSAAGNFDCRVSLDKEGPIHDFAWSPNSKEFGVVYGYMPAKSMLFDQRVRTLHDFGTAPHNFISFNPQGRLVLLGGFGNLAGKIDIIDRRTLNRITTIEAANTSHCEWSPDGRCILTATLSPRLRVDNGVKLWHCSGPLLHVQATEELYQASWRPSPVESAPPFGQGIPAAPPPGASVAAATEAAKPPVMKMGAYRPPGARGTATPMIFRREDEGGAARLPTTGTNSPSERYSRSPARNERRRVPGAAASPGPDQRDRGRNGHQHQQQSQDGKGKKKKGPKDVRQGGGSGLATPEDRGRETPMEIKIEAFNGAVIGEVIPPTPGDASLDPAAKKARNLNKKLKAIEELKEKASRGERLEATQLKKIESEAEIRKELVGLGMGVE